MLLATGASMGLARLLQVPFVFDAEINALAFVFSGAIGAAICRPGELPTSIRSTRCVTK